VRNQTAGQNAGWISTHGLCDPQFIIGELPEIVNNFRHGGAFQNGGENFKKLIFVRWGKALPQQNRSKNCHNPESVLN
jgi:hypothetical protein